MTGKKILIVDNEPDFVKILQLNLESHGYEIDGCTTARQALNRVKKNLFDLILVDFKMPKVRGDELIEMIGDISPISEFIIVTGFSTDGKIQEILETNPKVYACIQKPFDLQDLIAEIEHRPRG